MPQSDIGAFAAAFGDAFSATHNRRIQQQLAVKAQKDLEIADVLVKSVMDDPAIATDPDVMKFMSAKLGKENATGIASIAAAFNNSPMGILKRTLGADVDAMPVSAEADGPGTGPSVPLPEMLKTNPLRARDVVRGRLSEKSALETGLGYDNGAGQLRAGDIKAQTAMTPKPLSEKDRLTTGIAMAEHERKVKRDEAMVEKYRNEMAFKEKQSGVKNDLDRKKLAIQQARLDFSKDNAARQQRNSDRDFGLKKVGESRRGKFAVWSMAKGSIEDDVVTLPTGEQVPVKVRRFSPDKGQTIQEEIVRTRMQKTPEAPRDKIASINGALRYEDDLEKIYNENRESIAQVFAPFAGRTLAELQNNLGALSPVQQNFVQLLNELRASRSFINGGKALTATELALIDGTLPNVNVMVESFIPMLQKSREILTALGADTENSLNAAGYIAPPTRRSASNVDYYNKLRKPVPNVRSKPVTVWTAPPDDELGAPEGVSAPAAPTDPVEAQLLQLYPASR